MPQTAFITGCSSGFGKATAMRFLKAGWNVVATMRNPADWDGGESDTLLVHELDVTRSESIRSAWESAILRFGRVDAVVNIAGVGLVSVFETTTPEDGREMFEVNTFGPIEVMRTAIPYLREHGGGTIVNLTSASSIVPEPLMSLYNASKAALDNLTETVRLEVAPQNIRLRLVEPGFVPTTRLVEKASARLPELVVPPAYAAYVGQRIEHFAGERPYALATADDVADAVLASVEDDSQRLRWVVGIDQAERMRMRHETSEEQYIEWSWREFGPRG
jgi:NAD(P)-dependent dehydrogenase (short-subunit alcohol dehydrogenase family)